MRKISFAEGIATILTFEDQLVLLLVRKHTHIIEKSPGWTARADIEAALLEFSYEVHLLNSQHFHQERQRRRKGINHPEVTQSIEVEIQHVRPFS